MNPYLDTHRNPRLQIKVKLKTWKNIDCVIDTGFSGGIALPKLFNKSLVQKPLAYQEYELADGTHKTFAVYKFSVKYKHWTKIVTAFFTESQDGLLGIEFLTGFYLHLNLKQMIIELE